MNKEDILISLKKGTSSMLKGTHLKDYSNLVKSVHNAIINIDTIPTNDALKESLRGMLVSNSESNVKNIDLDAMTTMMQIVTTIDTTTFINVLFASYDDDKMREDATLFVETLKVHKNYIQVGGDPDTDDVIVMPGPVNPSERPIRNARTIILMILSLLLTILFANQGILAVEQSIIGGVDKMVTGLQDISDTIPISPLSSSLIESIQSYGASSEYEYDANTGALLLPQGDTAQGDAAQGSTAQIAIQSTIEKLDDTITKLPTMTTTERFGLLVGNVPKEYLTHVTETFSGIITQEVTPVFMRILAEATEAGVSRAWTSGASGNMFVQASNALSKFLGFGSALPIGDKSIEKGMETFQNKLQISLMSITSLVSETTKDMKDNVVNNVYGYGAYAFASLSFAVIQATILGLRMANTETQRNKILQISEAILNKISSPFLMLLITAEKGAHMVIKAAAETSYSLPPGAAAASGTYQYGGMRYKKQTKKRNQKSNHKQNKKRKTRAHHKQTKTRNSNRNKTKQVQSILKYGGSRKYKSSRSNLKKGTTKHKKRVHFHSAGSKTRNMRRTRRK